MYLAKCELQKRQYRYHYLSYAADLHMVYMFFLKDKGSSLHNLHIPGQSIFQVLTCRC